MLIKAAETQNVVEFLGTVSRYLTAASEKLDAVKVQNAFDAVFEEKDNKTMATLAQQWVEDGKIEGKQEFAFQLPEFKFGRLKEDTSEAIRNLNGKQLEALGKSLLSFGKIEDLDEWLARQAN